MKPTLTRSEAALALEAIRKAKSKGVEVQENIERFLSEPKERC